MGVFLQNYGKFLIYIIEYQNIVIFEHSISFSIQSLIQREVFSINDFIHSSS